MINGKQIIEIKYQTKIFDVEGLCDTIWQVNTFQQIDLIMKAYMHLKLLFFHFPKALFIFCEELIKQIIFHCNHS